MKTLRIFLNATALCGTLFFYQNAEAQKINQKTTVIAVNGTSPLHDWEMNSSAAYFTGTVNGNSISNATFTLPVKNLKSKKGSTMDNKAYEALKSSQYPTISFTAASINFGKSNVSGKLTIAGVSRNVSFPVSVAKNENTYTIYGTETVKLSDFGMSRPGFMGIKTGDEVTIKVSITAQ
ncbi:YceI family protein [Chryseobacterium sp. MHB01]|uniref:YceI family protein n=1 Tax=Chryseobacterium sp. MHB01 TaxID=3109433 RepID=UPI002AFEB573|nr:YceI family protein [Chryseobacterium sp. MHB01]MEA1847409.1 YceI family protein [Chryseobacterium sp. MHB01]